MAVPRKPSSVGATTNPPTASEIRQATGAAFPIKVWRVVGRHTVHTYDEVTGDGDSVPQYEHNLMQNGQYTIYGAMMADGELGIENLSAAAGSDTGNPVNFKFILSSGSNAGTTQTVTLLVTSLQYDWKCKGVYVPVMIQGIVTNTTASGIEGTS